MSADTSKSNNSRKAGISPAAPRHGREYFLAGTFYLLVLLLACLGHYLKGRGFLFEVIWDPVPVYLQYPGEQAEIRSMVQGELPKWIPNVGFGIPRIIISGASLEQPFKFFVFIWNNRVSWEIYLFLRLWLMGLGTFLLGRVINLNRGGALISGLAFMLCGYARVYLNFQDIGQLAMLPFFMAAFAAMVKRASLTNIILIAFFAHWVAIGGNPEIMMYTGAFTAAFTFAAAAVKSRDIDSFLKAVPKYIAICIICFGLTFLISQYSFLEISEYMGQSWSYHPREMGQLYVPLNAIIGLVTPVFDYWMSSSASTIMEQAQQFALVPTYLGLAVCVMSLVCVVHLRRAHPMAPFFAIMGIICLGVIFCIPGFSLFGYLPVARYIQNFRYLQPFAALSGAMLAGMGLDLIVARSEARKTAALILAILFFAILAEAYICRNNILKTAYILHAMATAGIIFLSIAAVFFVFWRSRILDKKFLLPWLIVIYTAAELGLYFHFIFPLFGPQAYQIEKQPEYVKFLARQPGLFRVMGLKPEVLHPNLAALYGLFDPRDYSPLYYKHYPEFFARLNGLNDRSRLIAHYLDQGRFHFEFDLSRVSDRVLDAINLRYLLGDLPLDSRLISEEARDINVRSPFPTYISTGGSSEINGIKRHSLLIHAPARVDGTISFNHDEQISAAVSLLPKAFEAEDADGALLMALDVADSSDKLLYARFLDPHHRADERRWIPADGWPITPGPARISLISLPGPRNNDKHDFAVFGDLLIKKGKPVNVRLVYDRDLYIYERPDALPRAGFIAQAEVLDSYTAVIDKMNGPGFDPWKKILLGPDSGKSISAEEGGAGQVSIIEYDFNRIELKLEAEKPGWVFVSDSYYPGWQALLDGAPVKIIRADFLFRAVPVPAGDHRIEFVYQPWGVRIGLLIQSISTIICICLLTFGYLYNRRQNKYDQENFK